MFKVTARDQGHYKGPLGAFVTYCNISCLFYNFCSRSMGKINVGLIFTSLDHHTEVYERLKQFNFYSFQFTGVLDLRFVTLLVVFCWLYLIFY